MPPFVAVGRKAGRQRMEHVRASLNKRRLALGLGLGWLAIVILIARLAETAPL